MQFFLSHTRNSVYIYNCMQERGITVEEELFGVSCMQIEWLTYRWNRIRDIMVLVSFSILIYFNITFLWQNVVLFLSLFFFLKNKLLLFENVNWHFVTNEDRNIKSKFRMSSAGFLSNMKEENINGQLKEHTNFIKKS